MTITAHFSLDNYPNPFNPITTIAFEIPENGHVLLTLHDLLGRHLTTLLDSEHTSGSHSLHFDASHLPSGLYIYRLAYNGHILTRTMSLLK